MESLFELVTKASEYKCKLTSHDIEEANNHEELLRYIQDVYNALANEYGVSKIKYWRMTLDGIRVVFVNNDILNIDYINGELVEE